MIVINQRLPRHQLLSAAILFRALRTAPRGQLTLAAAGWVTLLGVHFLPAGSPPRVMLVLGFVLICPGLAVSGLLPIRERAERLVLAIALSTSFGLLITVALTLLRIHSVSLRLALLALITTVAVLVDVRLSARGCVPPTTTLNGKAGT